ncbi:hypothetical protein RHMOL_Rhmol01G0178300 [Rhododendron molle]|uniref:Uncharacterized protein n=1 Tax=Rhododendron molle TaxID=49168 RepID=A0ACC0Q2J6_RHOML|nr:hypothetical protein RHMOL_Rhmol01G0178300 [Rhododendron molle]
MLVVAIPLQAVLPLTTFKRKKHTRTLVSISEEPSKTISSPRKRKALIPDFDEDISPSQGVPIVEPIFEENSDIMVDLNQIGNPEGSSDPSNPKASNVEIPIDSPPTVPETPLPESLKIPTPQDATLDLNLNGSSSSHMASSSTSPSFDVHAVSAKVKAFCHRICLPVQPSIVLSPVDELEVLLDPPASCLKPTFSKEEAQELIEIHQGFATLDFSFLIEHQLWDQFERCCQALVYLKPNNSELTQWLQHGISNIQSDFPYIQDLFQEQGALQMVEKDMENLHS